MSNVPAAARKQIREANRMIAEMAKLNTGGPASVQAAVAAAMQPTAATAPPAAPVSPAPAQTIAIQQPPNFAVVGAEIPPDAVPAFPTVETTPPASAPPAAPAVQWTPASQSAMVAPVPSEPAPTATSAPAPSHGPDYQQQYRVLQGKYNSEMRNMSARMATLEAQNQALMSRLLAQPTPAAAPAPAQPLTVKQKAAALGVSEAELKEYGEELVDMMLRIVDNRVNPEIARLASDNQRLQHTVGQTVQNVQRTARDLVYESLAAWNPRWEEINDSMEFLDWLNTHDVFSGATRRAGLTQAFETNDAPRVVAIFRAFVEEDARRRSTARQPQVDPATLVSPGTPRGGATAAPTGQNGGKIWSEAEIRDFYHRAQRKQISPDDRKRIEAEIHAALVEGRIQPEHSDAFILNSR